MLDVMERLGWCRGAVLTRSLSRLPTSSSFAVSSVGRGCSKLWEFNMIPQLRNPNTPKPETETRQAIIVHLLKEGEWYQATLLYRDETGAPRHLARREVERIAKQHAIQPKGGWWR